MNQVLVGRKAPPFKAKALVKGQIVEDFSLNGLLGKYVLLFFYPLDFTFVCPTELHAFQDALGEFGQRQAAVVACSVDSPYSHFAWHNIPKEKGGIEGVDFPLVSDLNKEIAGAYGVLKEEDGVAYRGQFLIDRQGVVRHQLVNDLPIGRSVEEALRLLDALIFFEQHGEVCPANWKKGQKALKPTAAGIQEYFHAP
jgi:peroxiredoxin (alkyl hydroperoxide reductase subunit C)